MVWDDDELEDKKELGGEAQGALGSRDVRARVLGCPVEAHGCPARVLLSGTAPRLSGSSAPLRLLCSSQAPLKLLSAPLVAVGGRPAAGGTTQLLAPPPNNQSPPSS